MLSSFIISDYNQYEHFRLIFSTDDIRADYHDISWQTELQAKINNTLSKVDTVSRPI